jgi:hypothetical protein
MQWAKQAAAAISSAGTRAASAASTPYNSLWKGGQSAYSWFTNSGVGATVGAGLIGGTASVLTGGTFTSGAMMGMAGGWSASGLRQYRNRGMRAINIGRNSLMGKAVLGATKTRNRAMFGGAALGGAIFGNRRKHSRGINGNRGSRM